MNILTEQEIALWLHIADEPINFARAIESAVLEKLKAQEPIGHVVFRKRRKAPDVDWAVNTQIHLGMSLYSNPPPPADVVRDAFKAGLIYASNKYEQVREERFSGGDVADFLFMECEAIDDTAIDAAMEEIK